MNIFKLLGFLPKEKGVFFWVWKVFPPMGWALCAPEHLIKHIYRKPLPDAIATSWTESDAFFPVEKHGRNPTLGPRTRHNPTSSNRNLAVPGRSPICSYFPPPQTTFNETNTICGTNQPIPPKNIWISLLKRTSPKSWIFWDFTFHWTFRRLHFQST